MFEENLQEQMTLFGQPQTSGGCVQLCFVFAVLEFSLASVQVSITSSSVYDSYLAPRHFKPFVCVCNNVMYCEGSQSCYRKTCNLYVDECFMGFSFFILRLQLYYPQDA